MATENRDDFSAKTKKVLAERVGFLCSCPNCRVPTMGPHTDPEKSANIGVAAHITAAAAGGPRYDANMSPADRSGISNGIWLCENCAKIIDKDPESYPVQLLQAWKIIAEQEMKEKRGKVPLSSTTSPILEAELIYNTSGRFFDGYSTDILEKYGKKPIQMGEVKNFPLHYKLDWGYLFVLMNNSETPAYNVSLEYVSGTKFSYMEDLPKVNNLKPFDSFTLKANFVIYFKGTYEEADSQISSKYPSLIQNTIIRLKYQDKDRNNHSYLLTIKEKGIIESRKEI